MAGTDDLAPLLTPDPARPPYGQGTIVAWNPDTFENVIEFRGQTLVDLPVKSSVEALTYQPGDSVILAKWSSSRGGSGTWWIDGRAIIPGPGAAEASVAWMTTTLGSAVARSVIGASVFFDLETSSGGAVRTAFDTFGDLEGAVDSSPSPGPEVSFDLTGDRFLAIWGAPSLTRIGTESTAEGWMGIEVSGTASIPPTVGETNQDFLSYPDVVGGMQVIRSGVAAHMFTEMTSGSYTVTAKYRIDDQGSSSLTQVVWRDRWLFVIAF